MKIYKYNPVDFSLIDSAEDVSIGDVNMSTIDHYGDKLYTMVQAYESVIYRFGTDLSGVGTGGLGTSSGADLAIYNDYAREMARWAYDVVPFLYESNIPGTMLLTAVRAPFAEYPDGEAIRLTWENVEGRCNKFDLYWSDGPFTSIDEAFVISDLTGTTYDHIPLVNKRRYFYRIKGKIKTT